MDGDSVGRLAKRFVFVVGFVADGAADGSFDRFGMGKAFSTATTTVLSILSLTTVPTLS